MIDDAAQPMVGQRCFVQGHAHAPHHAPQDLAARGFRVDHPSCCDGADHPGDLDRAKVLVNMHLHKDRRMCRGGEGLAPGTRLSFYLHFETSPRSAGDYFRQGQAMAARMQVAIGEDDLLHGGAGHFGIRVTRMFQQLAAQHQAGLAHGRAHRRHSERATLQRCCRQGGVPQHEGDILHPDAGCIGCDLGHYGVGAGTDVGGGATDGQVPLGIDAGFGAGLHLHGFPDPAGHAPADQLVAIAHAARLRVAVLPAETLGTLLVACQQLLAGVGLALIAIVGGEVAPAQVERVDLRGAGELIHGAFEGNHA
ncbi:hypothetical protein D3C76_729570 [compost metagenome]